MGLGPTHTVSLAETRQKALDARKLFIRRRPYAMKSRHAVLYAINTIEYQAMQTLGRRYSVTGPIESAELGGLDIIHRFAEFLFPSLDNITEPPEAVTALVRKGHFGLKTGKGIYDWSRRDGVALLAKRADRLFEHMAEGASSNN